VYRAEASTDSFKRLTSEPTPEATYCDVQPDDGVEFSYTVRAINRRGIESAAAREVTAAALPEIKDPLFVAKFEQSTDANLHGGGTAPGSSHGKAQVADGMLDLSQGGHATFEHRPEFDLTREISVECWVNLAEEGRIPVVVSCGHWQAAGWFLQKLGSVWRWYVGGINCDGGQPPVGKWTHLMGTFDGQTARLFQDGKLVAEKTANPILTPWPGPMFVGQYSCGPGAQYQVTGQISGLRIYGRAVSAQDAADAFHSQAPPKQP
jgi:hypothetical protein